MTSYGCEDGCLVCAGFACGACVIHDPTMPIGTKCEHDIVEQHQGMRALNESVGGPISSRVPTKPIPPLQLKHSIEVTVADDMIEAFAKAAEAFAATLRARGKVKITFE